MLHHKLGSPLTCNSLISIHNNTFFFYCTSARFRAMASPISFLQTCCLPCYHLLVPYLEQIHSIFANRILPFSARSSHEPSSAETPSQYFSGDARIFQPFDAAKSKQIQPTLLSSNCQQAYQVTHTRWRWNLQLQSCFKKSLVFQKPEKIIIILMKYIFFQEFSLQRMTSCDYAIHGPKI